MKSSGAHSQHGSCPGADPIERGKDEEHLTKVRGQPVQTINARP